MMVNDTGISNISVIHHHFPIIIPNALLTTVSLSLFEICLASVKIACLPSRLFILLTRDSYASFLDK